MHNADKHGSIVSQTATEAPSWGDSVVRLSKSRLDIIAQSPMHYWAKYIDPNRVPEPPKEWGIFGNAFHTAVLEPSKFDRRYVVLDDTDICNQIGGSKPRTTNKYKEWLDSVTRVNAGKTFLTKDDYEVIRRMQDSVYSHSIAQFLLVKGECTVEEKIDFTEPNKGVDCRLRRDAFQQKHRVTIDLKSTESAAPEDFSRSINNYRYHVQDAFYSDGHMAATNEYPQGFVFIVVEKKPPYITECYQLPDHAVALGRDLYMRDIDTYLRCKETGVWHGYTDGTLNTIDLPKWAYRV